MQMVALNPSTSQSTTMRQSQHSLLRSGPPSSSSATTLSSGLAMNPNLLESAQFANIMVEFDNGQKEMAVDVPDTFVAHTKTPPKFPTSLGLSSSHSSRNSSNSLGTKASSTSSMGSRSNGSGASAELARPVVNSYANSISIQPDASMNRQITTSSVDKLDYMQADKRSSTPKQLDVSLDNAASNSRANPVSLKQSQRIKEYARELRAKQSLTEKQSRSHEFLRLSMRNSQKIKKLTESGHLARATQPATSSVASPPSSSGGSDSFSMVQLVTALQRLESLDLDKCDKDLLIPANLKEILAHSLNMSQEVLLSSEFQRAHRLREKVQALRCSPVPCMNMWQPAVDPGTSSKIDPLFPSTLESTSLLKAAVGTLRDTFESRQPYAQASADQTAADELITLLTGQGELFAALMQVHDQIASIRLETVSNWPRNNNAAASNSEKSATCLPNDTTADDESALFRQIGRYSEANIKVIRIEKSGTEPLGATVRNEDDAVIVARIMRGGTAEASGLLHVGDELLEVNEIPLRGKNVNEVSDLLASMVGPLTFLVVPVADHLYSTSLVCNNNGESLDIDVNPTVVDGGCQTVGGGGFGVEPIVHSPLVTGHQMPVVAGILHIKALIDYDAEDDPYLPCKELGISYRKGDILHVLNQSDANWWQARREGEDDELFHSLPGLVPSPSFQEQREALKLALARDAGHLDSSKHRRKACEHSNSHHGTTGGRGRRSKKSRLLLRSINGTLGFGVGADKRRASMTFSPFYDVDHHSQSHQHMSSMLDGGVEMPLIATYEQVALYYPRSDRKRPIVLIGPPNIGRHDLRQRLMMDTTRFAAAIPHTSRPRRPDEVDGVDYHFISRVQFEQDIMARKFVEHGEYEKAYYGTSFDAIRRVADDENKICVLNLHPESLAALRQPVGLGAPHGHASRRHLMPFVVFVAPPSVEKLRQCRAERGETSGMRDNELRETVERARSMEAAYGHFFDMVIVFNDVNTAYLQLVSQINHLEREPQWVPAGWLPM